MQITKACLIKTRTIHFRVKSRNRNTDLESVFFPHSHIYLSVFHQKIRLVTLIKDYDLTQEKIITVFFIISNKRALTFSSRTKNSREIKVSIFTCIIK